MNSLSDSELIKHGDNFSQQQQPDQSTEYCYEAKTNTDRRQL